MGSRVLYKLDLPLWEERPSENGPCVLNREQEIEVCQELGRVRSVYEGRLVKELQELEQGYVEKFWCG